MQDAIPTNPNEYNWINEFHSFTSFHYLVLAICIGSFAAFCIAGRKFLKHDLAHGTNREHAFRRILALTIITSQAFFFIRRLTPEHWDIQDSLPMHLCRWTVWIAAWAMWSMNPKARSLLLFWGIALSSQVFFSPMITDGMGSMAFWIYWINHTQIIGAAIYDLAVLGYRPKRRDLYFGAGAGTAYGIFAVTLNAVLGTNYTYLGHGAHNAPSLVDQLGPYPLRTVWMILAGNIMCLIVYLFSSGMMTIRTRVFKRPAPRMFTAQDFQSLKKRN